MSISITGRRAQRTWLLIALTVSATACVRDPFETFTYNVDLKNQPLPPGVNSDPTQFRAQAAMRTTGPSHSRQRLGDCPPTSPCLVEVVIAPLGDTREVNPGAGVGVTSPLAPATGRPVAKIVNLDPTHSADMYGFRPSSRFEYYVWADTSASRARMTLLRVPAIGQPGLVQAVFQKYIQLCLHDPLVPVSSDADFRWCAGLSVSTAPTSNHAGMLPLAQVAALLSRAIRELIAEAPAPAEAPIWLRCTDGCCG